MDVRVRRVYDEVRDDDGRRVLIDRLWPRGLSKEDAALDEWNKDVTPSDAIRREYGHVVERWEAFRMAYEAELSGDRAEAVAALAGSTDGMLTLLTATKDLTFGHAQLLEAAVRDVR